MSESRAGDGNELREAIERSFEQQTMEKHIKNLEDKVDLRWAAHEREHQMMEESLTKAIATVDRERQLHVTAHDAAHVAHAHEHQLDSKATDIASSAHEKEHLLEKDARDKAEQGIDKRLEGMNEVRAQLKDQAVTFARVEVVAALTDRIIAIEKLDIKGEGRTLGQGTVVAAIVGAVSFASLILGLIIVVANLLTGGGVAR